VAFYVEINIFSLKVLLKENRVEFAARLLLLRGLSREFVRKGGDDVSVGHCALPSSGEPFSGASHEQVIFLFKTSVEMPLLITSMSVIY